MNITHLPVLDADIVGSILQQGVLDRHALGLAFIVSREYASDRPMFPVFLKPFQNRILHISNL